MRFLVACPLHLERKLLLGAGLGRRHEVICCGPGPDAVRRWSRHRSHSDAPPTTVILAGLAGALDPGLQAGDAYLVTRVREHDADRTWTPPLGAIAAGSRTQAAVVLTCARVVASCTEKDRLHKETGASMVDLESAAFAEAATEAGWHWGIVRGISDGPQTRLPAGVAGWVSRDGRTRPAAALASLAARPVQLPDLWRLRRDSRRAMDAVARLIEGLAAQAIPPRRDMV